MLIPSSQWQGRTDNEDGASGIRWHQHINSTQYKDADAVLMGFACDIGVANNKGRVGAKAGPDKARHAMANSAWHLSKTLFDAGDIVAKGELEAAQQEFAQHVSKFIADGRFVLGIGGGHEMAWASYLGVSQALHETVGIVNIDAHFDLRKPAPQCSSGTPFYQAWQYNQQHGKIFDYTCLGVAKTANTRALFERAERANVQYVLDRDCSFESLTTAISNVLERVDVLYLTVCLDAFNASSAPGVSAPSTLGVDVGLILRVIDWLGGAVQAYGVNWAMADIAELNPTFDIDQRTAKLTARLANDILDARFTACTLK